MNSKKVAPGDKHAYDTTDATHLACGPLLNPEIQVDEPILDLLVCTGGSQSSEAKLLFGGRLTKENVLSQSLGLSQSSSTDSSSVESPSGDAPLLAAEAAVPRNPSAKTALFSSASLSSHFPVAPAVSGGPRPSAAPLNPFAVQPTSTSVEALPNPFWATAMAAPPSPFRETYYPAATEAVRPPRTLLMSAASPRKPCESALPISPSTAAIPITPTLFPPSSTVDGPNILGTPSVNRLLHGAAFEKTCRPREPSFDADLSISVSQQKNEEVRDRKEGKENFPVPCPKIQPVPVPSHFSSTWDLSSSSSLAPVRDSFTSPFSALFGGCHPVADATPSLFEPPRAFLMSAASPANRFEAASPFANARLPHNLLGAAVSSNLRRADRGKIFDNIISGDRSLHGGLPDQAHQSLKPSVIVKNTLDPHEKNEEIGGSDKENENVSIPRLELQIGKPSLNLSKDLGGSQLLLTKLLRDGPKYDNIGGQSVCENVSGAVTSPAVSSASDPKHAIPIYELDAVSSTSAAVPAGIARPAVGTPFAGAAPISAVAAPQPQLSVSSPFREAETALPNPFGGALYSAFSIPDSLVDNLVQSGPPPVGKELLAPPFVVDEPVDVAEEPVERNGDELDDETHVLHMPSNAFEPVQDHVKQRKGGTRTALNAKKRQTREEREETWEHHIRLIIKTDAVPRVKNEIADTPWQLIQNLFVDYSTNPFGLPDLDDLLHKHIGSQRRSQYFVQSTSGIRRATVAKYLKIAQESTSLKDVATNIWPKQAGSLKWLSLCCLSSFDSG
jgi:hypothetical protein